jgi:CheY-like chemotaxis protein
VLQGDLANALLLATGATPLQPLLPAPHNTAPSEPRTLAPLDILLVEDHPSNQRLAITLLERWGNRITLAQDGREALDKLASQRFDLVLMDMQMPVIDGLEATRMFRATEQGQRTPIIAMTANAMQGDKERCLAAGMDGYLTKPFKRDQLRAVLELYHPRPNEAASFDYAKALRETEQEVLEIVGEQALDIFPQDFAALRAAVAAGDHATITRMAHSIKGNAAIFYAQPLADMANQIEQGLAGNQLEPRIDAMEKEFMLLAQALRSTLGCTRLARQRQDQAGARLAVFRFVDGPDFVRIESFGLGLQGVHLRTLGCQQGFQRAGAPSVPRPAAARPPDRRAASAACSCACCATWSSVCHTAALRTPSRQRGAHRPRPCAAPAPAAHVPCRPVLQRHHARPNGLRRRAVSKSISPANALAHRVRVRRAAPAWVRHALAVLPLGAQLRQCCASLGQFHFMVVVEDACLQGFYRCRAIFRHGQFARLWLWQAAVIELQLPQHLLQPQAGLLQLGVDSAMFGLRLQQIETGRITSLDALLHHRHQLLRHLQLLLPARYRHLLAQGVEPFGQQGPSRFMPGVGALGSGQRHRLRAYGFILAALPNQRTVRSSPSSCS